MKKFLLTLLPLLTSIFLFAQDQEDHSAEYNWGEKNALWVIIGVAIVIILIIVWFVRRKKKS